MALQPFVVADVLDLVWFHSLIKFLFLAIFRAFLESFKPNPVMGTIIDSSCLICPPSRNLFNPESAAAEVGSQKIPSFLDSCLL